MKLFKDWPRFVAVAFPPRHIVIAVNTADLPDPLLEYCVGQSYALAFENMVLICEYQDENLLPDNKIDKWT